MLIIQKMMRVNLTGNVKLAEIDVVTTWIRYRVNSVLLLLCKNYIFVVFFAENYVFERRR